MGMKDEMKKFEKAEHGQIVASFDRTNKEKGTSMTIEVNGVSNKEIEAMIKSFLFHLAKENKVHVTSILKDLVTDMMLEELERKEKDDDSV